MLDCFARVHSLKVFQHVAFRCNVHSPTFAVAGYIDVPIHTELCHFDEITFCVTTFHITLGAAVQPDTTPSFHFLGRIFTLEPSSRILANDHQRPHSLKVSQSLPNVLVNGTDPTWAPKALVMVVAPSSRLRASVLSLGAPPSPSFSPCVGRVCSLRTHTLGPSQRGDILRRHQCTPYAAHISRMPELLGFQT